VRGRTKEDVLKKLIVVALAGLATLALPVVGASAKPPWAGGEKAGGQHGKSHRCAKPRRVGFVVAGSLAAWDGTSMTLTVARGNRHARRWLDVNEPVFDLTDLTVRFNGVADGDASGTVDMADVLPTDRVRVSGKLALPKRGCVGDSELVVRRVRVKRESPADSETETQEPAETETQS